jgi:hypothetical protein
MSTAPIYPASPIKRHRATKAEVEQRRERLFEIVEAMKPMTAGLVPVDIALRALLRAANAMPDHDAGWPWRPEEIDLKVRRAFHAGQQHPREVRRAVA